MGHGATSDIDKSQFCAGCKKEKGSGELKCCSVCNITLYCSKECQGNHWPTHKRLCKPHACSGIKKQATQSQDKVKCKERGAPEKTSTVSELVGKKCVIWCFLHKQKIQALWDTGSQVCAVDEIWKNSHLPDFPLRDVSELVDQWYSSQWYRNAVRRMARSVL